MLHAQQQRTHLAAISEHLQRAVVAKGYSSPSSSHIVPIIVGESQAAVDQSKRVQDCGFYAMPVRPPTVPQHSARLRISLTSMIQLDDLDRLVSCL